jgi:sec-independent protein translocase protein TatB
MLPDAGAFELIFLAAVALIVVGPKDLPVLLRKLGQFLARMRGLAAEFRASFDELARQSELDELRKEVEALRNSRFTEPLAVEMTSAFSEIHQGVVSDTAAVMTPDVTPASLAASGEMHAAELKAAAEAEPAAPIAAPEPSPPKVRKSPAKAAAPKSDAPKPEAPKARASRAKPAKAKPETEA